MRTTFVSLVWVSLETLKTAIVGVTSIGFQTVPLICKITLDCPGSLHVTVACLITEPPKLAELNWSGMMPVLPGSTFLSQASAVVQPHPGRTARCSSVAAPTLVNTKSSLTSSPEFTLVKSYTMESNWIFGPAAGATAGGGVGSLDSAAIEARVASRVVTVNDDINFIFINFASVAQVISSCTKKNSPIWTRAAWLRF